MIEEPANLTVGRLLFFYSIINESFFNLFLRLHRYLQVFRVAFVNKDALYLFRI